MRINHDDRPPGALAHGAVKTSDIERVRGEVTEAALGAAVRRRRSSRTMDKPMNGRAKADDVHVVAVAGRGSAARALDPAGRA